MKSESQRHENERFCSLNYGGSSAKRIVLIGWHILLFLVFTVGCQSGIYRAKHLPAEYRATSVVHQSTIQWGNLSSSGGSNSRISPGDLLEIAISSGLNSEEPTPVLARVSDNGKVELPAIGIIPVSDLELSEASRNIQEISIQRGIYLHPNVTVNIKTKITNQITVLGKVANPGVHEIPRGGCDLISALGAAGGLAEEASTSIEIIRHTSNNTFAENGSSGPVQKDESENLDESSAQLANYSHLNDSKAQDPNRITVNSFAQTTQSERIDLASTKSISSNNNHLNDQDVVIVHEREKRFIHVAGLVKKPGQFELPVDQNVRLLDAIALAGGLNSLVADKVLVIRPRDNELQPLVIKASLKTAKLDGRENIRLSAGDSIQIEQTPTTIVVDTFSKVFRIAMGVSGNVTSF
ncbi:MAG: SLBB domain-containing protein [Pirellulales bacterium]